MKVHNRIPKVLVVDDEKPIRESIRFTLDSFCSVVTADSIESARDILEYQLVDTIILDLNFPGMNGRAGIPFVRSVDSEVGIIICTACSLDREHFLELRRRGAHDFIQKPFNVKDLIDLCMKSIQLTTRRREWTNLRSSEDESKKRCSTRMTLT